MHTHRTHEMFRFELDDLRYRALRFADGQIVLTVAGDPFRLGLLTQEDVRWHWDDIADLPAVQETTLRVPVGAQATHVLRTVAGHLARHLLKHRPNFFYYRLGDDGARRQQVYARLLARFPAIAQLYHLTVDETGTYQMFSLRAVGSLILPFKRCQPIPSTPTHP